MSDLVFAIDVFQSQKDNPHRVLCPVDASHGPMFVTAGAVKMLCNDTKCKAEQGVPPELIAKLHV